MRLGKALALLSEQERKFDRERAEWRDERGRLLNRIMELANHPMPDSQWFPPAPDETDVFDADQTLGDDLYPPLDLPVRETDLVPSNPYPHLSPRERMLREDG